MEKRLTLELRGRQSNKVKELDLDGVKCGGELDFGDFDFQNLEFLSIREAQLTTLKNFPNLPNLSRLDLSKNRIVKLEELKECKKLKYLMLGGNRIKHTPELEFLEPLISLSTLTHLELGEEFYPEDLDELSVRRAKIFAKLPNLQYLEGDDINGKPEEELDDEDEDDEGDDDEDDDDEENGINGHELDGDDELDDDDDDLEEEEEAYEEDGYGVRNNLNGIGDLNGTLQDYDSSDAEDEQDDDDEEDDDDEDPDRPPVRGKKRKFEDEGLP